MELFLQKKVKAYPEFKKAMKDARDLRELRNIDPIHSSTNTTKIFKKFMGKIPKIESDWVDLNQVSFAKFRGFLILLRDILK
jgi:hypothetical protein